MKATAKKKTAPKKKTLPTSRATSKAVPAAAYDGAPSQFADGSPVFVRWPGALQGDYKLGILVRYTSTGKPVVCVAACTPKGAYTGKFGSERTFEPGEVTRVYHERDWETIGDGESGKAWDARHARGPANDELGKPRSQVELFHHPRIIDSMDADDVIEAIKAGKPLTDDTLLAVASYMYGLGEANEEWKKRCDELELKLDQALERPARIPLPEQKPMPRNGDIIILQLPKKQTERAMVELVSHGEMHFVCIDGNGGSRPLTDEGKTWQRDPDATRATFKRATDEYEAKAQAKRDAKKLPTHETAELVPVGERIGLPLGAGQFREGSVTAVSSTGTVTFLFDDGGNMTSTMRALGTQWCLLGDDAVKATVPGVTVDGPKRGDKIQISINDGSKVKWSPPVDVLRMEGDKILFGRLGRDLKTDRIDGAYRLSSINELWRSFDKTLPAAPAVTPAPSDSPAPGSMSMTNIQVKVDATGRIAARGGTWIDAVIEGNDGEKLMVGYRLKGMATQADADLWRRTMLKVSDEGVRWRRMPEVQLGGGTFPVTPVAANDDRAIGMPVVGQGIEVKVGRKWERVIVDIAGPVIIAFHAVDGLTEGTVRRDEQDKRWRLDTTVASSPRFPNGQEVVDSLKREDDERKAARTDNPLMKPAKAKAAAREIEKGRQAVESAGVNTVAQAAAADSPVDRAVAANQPPMTLHRRNLAAVKRLGVSLDEVMKRREEGTLDLGPEDREAEAASKRELARTTAGIGSNGSPIISMPRIGDAVYINSLDRWVETEVTKIREHGFIVKGGLVLDINMHGTHWKHLDEDVVAARARNAALMGITPSPQVDATPPLVDDEERALADRRELRELAATADLGDEADAEEPAPWEDGFGDPPLGDNAMMVNGQPDDDRAPWEVG